MVRPSGSDEFAALTGLVDDESFRKLDRELGRFNIFHALGVARAETRHSNFLAWLLDPSGSHQRGDAFLRAFLVDLISQSDSPKGSLSSEILNTAPIEGVHVRREWRNIDVLLSCESPRLVVAIENKIDTGEHSDQLGRYESIVAERFPGWPVIHVLLSPNRREASRGNWLSWGLADCHRVVSGVRLSAAGWPDDVGHFVDHYLHLLQSTFMDNPQVDAMCRGIVRKHRRAVELLHRFLQEKDVALLEAVAERISSEVPGFAVVRIGASLVNVAPVGWETLLPQICDSPGNAPWEILLLEFRLEADALDLQLKIGPSSDPGMRTRLIKALEADPRVCLRTKQTPSNRWLGLWQKLEIDSWQSGEPDTEGVSAKAVAALLKLRPQLDAVTEVVLRFTGK